jgi:aspartate-semialdehyde dehydrogenase
LAKHYSISRHSVLGHSVSRTAKVALVGGETLLGRELEDVLGRAGSRATVTAYTASGEGNFGSQDGEAIYLESLTADTLRGQEAIVLAGTSAGAFKAYDLASALKPQPQLIDCVGYLEGKKEARIVAAGLGAPTLGRQQPRASRLQIVAHPAAFAIAQVLIRLAQRAEIERSLVNVFEPASEQGQRGISELQQQTSSLLSFKALDKQVFGAQLSFNLLPQSGEDAAAKLSNIEQRIERHVATLLSRAHEDKSAAARAPMPSLRLIQAPVFHGYSISMWIELKKNPDVAELAEALRSPEIEVRDADEEAPNNVGAAGQSGLTAGDIRVDRNNARAAWLWIVCDNLRLVADQAASLIGALQGERL